MVFTLGCAVAHAVPDADHARDIAGRNVEAGGREACYGCGCCVGCVLLADSGVIDGPNEDGFPRLQKEIPQVSLGFSSFGNV